MKGFELLRHYRLRLTRKRLLWRAYRARRALRAVHVDAGAIAAAPILAFSTMRNERARLPSFLAHYRRLGVSHFLIVSNDSTDETDTYLGAQPDVSLWTTGASYRDAGFGMAWMNWLLRRYGAGKWTVTVDADELLIYPDWEVRDLSALTATLDAQAQPSFGAMLLDLYPKGPLDRATFDPETQHPWDVLPWFDAYGYWGDRRGRHQAVCLAGGPRARVFFAENPAFAPVLSKVPLVRWHKSYAYLSSTHVALPPSLNAHHDTPKTAKPSGLLLHTKFLPGVALRAKEDFARAQQYTKGPAHDAYYAALATTPELWTPTSTRLEGAEQLEKLGLLRRGDWL